MNPYLNFILSLPATLFLALVSWYCVEKPCLRLKDIHIPILEKASEKTKVFWEKRDRILDRISEMNWPIFWIIVVVIFGVIGISTYIPSKMHFPGTNAKMIVYGWYPDTNNSYAFVRKCSVFKITAGRNASVLYIEGFVPENLQTDVNAITVFLDDNPVIHNYDLKANQGLFQFHIDLPTYSYAILPIVHTVRIEFDGEHVPTSDDIDIRTLSAAITHVEVQ